MTSAWYPRAWLTERGFDPDGDLGTGTQSLLLKRNPLYRAAQAGELSVCVWLYDRGAATSVVQSPSRRNGDSPLMAACAQGHLDVAKWLFGHGASEDATRVDEHGSSPLYYACWGGHLNIVQWLVEDAGASRYVRKRNTLGLAPIHCACLKGHLLVAQWLLDHGAAADLWNDKTRSFDVTAISVSAGNARVTEWLHARFKSAARPAQSSRCPTTPSSTTTTTKELSPALSPDQAGNKTSNPMLQRLSPKNTPPPLPQTQQSPLLLNQSPLSSIYPHASSLTTSMAGQSNFFLENQEELWLPPSNPHEVAARQLGLEASSRKAAGDIEGALKAYEEKLLVEHTRERGATQYMIGELHAFRATTAGQGGSGESATDDESLKQLWVQAEASFKRAAEADPSIFAHDSELAYANARVRAESAAEVKEGSASDSPRAGSPASMANSPSTRNILQRSKSNDDGDHDPPTSNSSGSIGAVPRKSSSSRKSVSKRAVNFLGRAAGGGAVSRRSSTGSSAFLGLGNGQGAEFEKKPKGPAEKLRSALLERRSVWQFDFGSSDARKVDAREDHKEEGKGGGKDGATQLPPLAVALRGSTLSLHGSLPHENDTSSDKAAPVGSKTAVVAAGPSAKSASSKQQSLKVTTGSIASSAENASRVATLTMFSPNDDYDSGNATRSDTKKQEGTQDPSVNSRGEVKDAASLGIPQDQEVKRTVTNIITGSEPFTVKKASRYLGDQGSLVEFSLDFAAPLSFKGCEPTSSSSSKTKIHFRGVIESNASKVMTGCAYIRASKEQVAARQKAASAFSHFEQAFILSNLGDATFDLQAFLLAQSSATSCSSSNNDSYHDGVGADDTSSASNKGKPSRPPLSQRTSSQSKNASKLSLFGALGFSTYALRRSGSHNGGSALRMPQPRSIDKGTTMEDVVVDKDGLGWLKLGNFRASKQDFALHSDDRLGVLRTLKYMRSNCGAAAENLAPSSQPSIIGNAANILQTPPPLKVRRTNPQLPPSPSPVHIRRPSTLKTSLQSPAATGGKSGREEAQALALRRWQQRRSSKAQLLLATNNGRNDATTAIPEALSPSGNTLQLDATLRVAQAAHGFTLSEG